MHFGRVLRDAGLPVGTDRVATALQALQVAGLASRQDFHAVLSACLLDRAEHRELFDQAFQLFWQDPDLEGRLRALLLPKVQVKGGTPPAPENRRLASALFPNAPQRQADAPPPEELILDATLTWSQKEVLRQADFETMTAEEWQAAKRLLARLELAFEPLPTRRTAPARGGRIDWRAAMSAMARHGGELGNPPRRAPRTRPPPVVLLADISGSMSRYSRMLLHFAHALGRAEAQVESFVFGTRLTRTTRLLNSRDPDLAVAQVARSVPDWAGGTRITDCLREFNRRWSRRVLPGNATLLLVTDGLEHGSTAELAFEMERLHKSCRRLIWLNPLLRFDRFEPRAGGIKAMLPHVDRFLPAHNLDSLERLARALAARFGDSGRGARPPPPRGAVTTPAPAAGSAAGSAA